MPSSSKSVLVSPGSKMGSKEEEVVKKVIQFYQKDDVEEILDHFKKVTLKGTHAEQYALKNVLWPIPTRSDLEIISNFFYSRDVRGLFSIGCGTGLLEWLIAQFYEDCHYKSKYEFADFDNMIDNSLLIENTEEKIIEQTEIPNCDKLNENEKNGQNFPKINSNSLLNKELNEKSCANGGSIKNEQIDEVIKSAPNVEAGTLKNCENEKKLSVKCIEVDSSWWESKYAPPVFHYLHYFGETFDLEEYFGEQGDAILFSYFNSGELFKKYLQKFRGSYVVLIGPVAKQYCDPSPLDLKENKDFPTADWDLILYQRFGLEDVDFIGIYERTSEHSS